MVAPHPLEPLVLYLAATLHSASSALVAAREEGPTKGLQKRSTPCLARAPLAQDGAPEATSLWTTDGAPSTLADFQDTKAPENGAPEALAALAGDEVPEDLPPRELQDSTNTSTLVEHPVYFFDRMLRDARARYPIP